VPRKRTQLSLQWFRTVVQYLYLVLYSTGTVGCAEDTLTLALISGLGYVTAIPLNREECPKRPQIKREDKTKPSLLLCRLCSTSTVQYCTSSDSLHYYCPVLHSSSRDTVPGITACRVSCTHVPTVYVKHSTRSLYRSFVEQRK